MAVGDMMADIVSIATTAVMQIRPASGTEAVIHNIYIPDGKQATLKRTDGTNVCTVDTVVGGGWLNFNFHVNYADYIEVVNDDGSTQKLAYDGIVTKI